MANVRLKRGAVVPALAAAAVATVLVAIVLLATGRLAPVRQPPSTSSRPQDFIGIDNTGQKPAPFIGGAGAPAAGAAETVIPEARGASPRPEWPLVHCDTTKGDFRLP